MDIKSNFQKHKVLIFLISIPLLLLIYLAINFAISGTSPLHFLSIISSPFLLFVEKFANFILFQVSSKLTIQDHCVFLDGILINGFTSQLMYKKVTLFYILIVWLTQTPIRQKIGFTGIYLALGFLSATAYIVGGAYYFGGFSNFTILMSTIHSLVFFCMNTVLLLMYLSNKKSSYQPPFERSRLSNLLKNKYLDIILVIYVYTIILFSLSYFYFHHWIAILLKLSSGILGLFGYDSHIESTMIIGDYGSISVYRTCLGIMTMFFFAAMIYLTGKNNKKTWIYIILGLVLLYVANIFRIVLLFIYIQKHGTSLALDVHDVFNYVTYLIVFILWVVWFERFMDLKTVKKRIGLNT